MADEIQVEQAQDDRSYEPPTLTVLGKVEQLTSEIDSSETPK